MKVCFVSPYGLSRVSGVTAVVTALARALVERGHVATIAAPGPAVERSQRNVAVLPLEAMPPFATLKLVVRATKTLWRHRDEWNVLHAHQGHPATVAASLVAGILGRPVIATFHLFPPVAEGPRGWVERLSIRLLAALASEKTFVSANTRETYGIPGTVIYNAIDASRIHTLTEERDSVRNQLKLAGFVVAFAGRRAKIKGYFDLLHAVAHARDSGIDITLLTTGETAADEAHGIVETVRTLGLHDRVRDLGSRRDHLRFLSAADAFALPSYREGLPVAILEAMAIGLPIVATNVGGIPEIVEDGRTALLVRPGDIEGLSSCLTKLGRDPYLRAELGRRALERVRSFTWDAAVNAYLRLYGRHLLAPWGERPPPSSTEHADR